MNTNRLANEKSPYLLQHKNNPVDWYPWGDEAFNKAAREDKPVFLSIGYSTCHWCHVMEKESFEDESVARLMNEAFVNIKVDREERPDIDGIYMTVCQMLTGSGGWPLTIIMTSDKKPFFAGTYFPKEGKYGRMGMTELIPRIQNLWQNRKDDVIKSSADILKELEREQKPEEGDGISEAVFKKAYDQLDSRFDNSYGGFGKAPKFPTPHNLIYLLRYYNYSGEKHACDMVEKTLTEMRRGGIYDHIGFGFHRYSTDERWLVPHFEKMLYDQALLVPAYTEMYQINKKWYHKRTAEEILAYVLRDMTSPDGGFYSAEDADSEGEEGKFYVWTKEEITEILGNEDADLAFTVVNIKKDGNWVDPMAGGTNGTNIIHLQHSIAELSAEMGIAESDLLDSLERIRFKLFIAREQRVHPHKDDKILTDWNALMISAFAKAYTVFGKEEYLSAAVASVNFILKCLRDEKGNLVHRWRDGAAGIPAHLDDYAFLIAALLDLYEATFQTQYLRMAENFTQLILAKFWHRDTGGFYFTSAEGEKLIIRQKEIYDGAVPSGNSVMLSNLIRFSRMSGRTGYEDKAGEMVKYFGPVINKAPVAYSMFLTGYLSAYTSKEIVITCRHIEDAAEFISIIREAYIPGRVLLVKTDNNLEDLAVLAPFTRSLKITDTPAVYFCENFSCDLPVYDKEELIQKVGLK